MTKFNWRKFSNTQKCCRRPTSCESVCVVRQWICVCVCRHCQQPSPRAASQCTWISELFQLLFPSRTFEAHAWRQLSICVFGLAGAMCTQYILYGEIPESVCVWILCVVCRISEKKGSRKLANCSSALLNAPAIFISFTYIHTAAAHRQNQSYTSERMACRFVVATALQL